jgi:hypothetical protein
MAVGARSCWAWLVLIGSRAHLASRPNQPARRWQASADGTAEAHVGNIRRQLQVRFRAR